MTPGRVECIEVDYREVTGPLTCALGNAGCRATFEKQGDLIDEGWGRFSGRAA